MPSTAAMTSLKTRLGSEARSVGFRSDEVPGEELAVRERLPEVNVSLALQNAEHCGDDQSQDQAGQRGQVGWIQIGRSSGRRACGSRAPARSERKPGPAECRALRR